MMTSAPSVLADEPVFGYVGPTNLVGFGNRQPSDSVTAARLAVMKAESSCNPAVVSKAGAVGLMQLIPETAIRHGMRNLYDTKDNITSGAKYLRYPLDRLHENLRLAVAAYNADERKVIDRDRSRAIRKHRIM